jgi:hypothetical protein
MKARRDLATAASAARVSAIAVEAPVSIAEVPGRLAG